MICQNIFSRKSHSRQTQEQIDQNYFFKKFEKKFEKQVGKTSWNKSSENKFERPIRNKLSSKLTKNYLGIFVTKISEVSFLTKIRNGPMPKRQLFSL